MPRTDMYLIEIFLPVADNKGVPFSREQHEAVKQALTERFGGVTAYPRAPASGRWKASSESEQKNDDLIVYEVLAEELDESWWLEYRNKLEEMFRQDRLLIRSHSIRLL